jgi:hypothetical protein
MAAAPVAFCLAALLLAACSAQIDGVFEAAGRAELSVSAAVQPKTAAMIRRVLSKTSGSSPSALLNAAALNNSFARLESVERASFYNRTPNLLDGRLVVARIDELVAQQSGGEEARRFITWEQNAGGGRAFIHIDRKNGPKIVEFLSGDLSAYLAALMAPVATGEELGAKEYLELVRSVYDADIASEIESSRVKLKIKFPARIRSVKGGSGNADVAEFDVPLLSLLVLEKPLSYEVTWQR